jgi:nitrogen fixation protein FixH
MAKVGEVAKFKDRGPSVDEARAAMLAAGETPAGLLIQTTKEVAKAAGGNLPVVPVAAPSRVQRKTPTQARLTLLNPDGTDGETTVITAKSTFELNGIISRNNQMAQKNKKHIRVDFIDPNESVQEVETLNASAAVVVEPHAAVADEDEPVEVTENAKFRLEIKQTDGKWIAEIAYKTGGGVERFEATSRKALNMKLLEGKAHATLRVREAIRREKYGVQLDEFYTLPDYMTQEAFDSLPQPAQQGIVDAVAMNEALTLHKIHPEFYITEENSEKMQRFLNNKKLPYTVTNLVYAYEELAEAEELETRPVPTPAPSVSRAQTPAGDSAAAGRVPTVVPATSDLPVPVSAVRKRVSTGLQPGQSSTVSTELESVPTEEAAKPSSEPTEAELRSMPLSELKKTYKASLKPQGQRRF